MTNYEKIIEALRESGVPLQRKDLNKKVLMDDGVLGVVLYQGVKKGLWYRVSYPKTHSYYALVEWIGNDSHTLKFINPEIEPTIHGIKTESPRVPNT
jgi:hypothetical protein